MKALHGFAFYLFTKINFKRISLPIYSLNFEGQMEKKLRDMIIYFSLIACVLSYISDQVKLNKSIQISETIQR